MTSKIQIIWLGVLPAIVLALPWSPAFGNDFPPVDRVYSEVTYSGERDVWYRPNRPVDFSTVFQGSGFIVEIDERPLFVTAAHLYLGADPETVRIPQDRTAQFYRTDARRVRVGQLALVPLRILVDPDLDLCILELRTEEADLMAVARFAIDQIHNGPQIRDRLEIWGFPGERSAQLAQATVSSIHGNFFVLNSPFEGGFSGGPVMDGNGNLVGLLLRSTERQSRSLPGRHIRQALLQYDQRAADYSD